MERVLRFWLWFGCAWLWLAEELFQKWRWLLFIVLATWFPCKAISTSTTNQHNSRVWSLGGICKLWEQGLHFLLSFKLDVYWLKCKHFFHFHLLDIAHLQKPLVLCCPNTLLSISIQLIEIGHRWTVVCRVTNSSSFSKNSVICFFLLSLQALVT